MFAYVLLVNGLFIGLNIYLQQQFTLLLTALLSSLYYLQRTLQHKPPSSLTKRITGEAPHQLLYLLWLCYFPKGEYLFFLPLALSTLGKTTLLLASNSEEGVEKGQELILFQTKCEAFILGYLCLSLLRLDVLSVVELGTFAVLVKLKYSFYYPSQKAFVELHFAFDNLTRRWGCRPLYHLLYMAVTVFSSTYATDREIAY
jgi:hypothetical protein